MSRQGVGETFIWLSLEQELETSASCYRGRRKRSSCAQVEGETRDKDRRGRKQPQQVHGMREMEEGESEKE